MHNYKYTYDRAAVAAFSCHKNKKDVKFDTIIHGWCNFVHSYIPIYNMIFSLNQTLQIGYKTFIYKKKRDSDNK